MVLDKGLLLKGLAGVAALGGVGGVGGVVIKNKLDERAAEGKAKEDEQKNLEEINGKKNAKKEEVNEKLKTLGIVGCDLVDSDVTSPTVFSKDCELDKTKFQAIKFSNKPEASNVTVEGWDNQNSKINLKIENKDQDKIKFTFSNAPTNLIVKGGDGQDNKFSIKANKETEFEEKPEGKLSKKVNADLSTKLKNYNTKLESLSLPASCRFDDTEEDRTIECDIKESELKNIKFSNKADNAELELSGLNSGDKIKLIVERDSSTTPESLKYKFKNDNSSKIILTGTTGDQTKFSIKASSETEFEENENKLSKKVNEEVSNRLKTYNTKFGNLSLPETCRFDDTEEDSSFECEIDQNDFKKIKFSNKGDDADLHVTGWSADNKITLKVQEKEEKNGVKYTFKNIKDNLTITKSESEQTEKFTLKTGVEREFEEKGESGKLSKVVDGALSEKLKGFNKNLGDLSIPDGCRFDETENDTKKECSISEDQFKKIKFWNKGDQDLKVSEGTGFLTIKLVLSKNGDNLKYLFKDLNRKIVVSGDSNKSFSLKEHTDAEFELREDVLGRPRNIDGVAGKVGLTCTYDDSSKGNSGTCTLGNNKHINVSSDGTTTASLQFYEDSSIKEKKGQVKFDFSEYEYEDNYEHNVKFTYKEETLEDTKNSGKLEKNSNYEVKTVSGVNCLSKKTPQESQ